MANELTYQSVFTGQEMDERFTAVAQLQAALLEVETALSAKYVKPASGIPETDLDSAVQSALAKARSAVQDLSNYYTKTEIDSLLAAVNSQEYVDVATLPTASASTLGKIYLVGPTDNEYDRYYTSYDGSDYSWVAAGSTEINLSNYATKAELNQLDQYVKSALEDIGIFSLGIITTDDDGFFVVDENLNVGLKYDGNGLDVAVLSDHLRSLIGIGQNEYDLFIFAGQSNMAGRGATTQQHPETAPLVIDGAGYEYRAVSDPTKLYPITEPFGVNENHGSISESTKTGSMVSAFANAYYEHTKTPIIGISASKGGTSISQWQPGGGIYTEMMSRYESAITWLTENGYRIRHKFVLWMQGETDGDDGTIGATYKGLFNSLMSALSVAGIEKLFMVRIGNYNGSSAIDYSTIIEAQTEIAQTDQSVVMATTIAAGMKDGGLMKDASHYYQEGYNKMGDAAGRIVAQFVMSGNEPTMYDPEYNDLYYSHKN